jgi:hypothetical protein
VEPFDAAIIAAVLPAFCEAGNTWSGSRGGDRSDAKGGRGLARRGAAKRREETCREKAHASANERACANRWRLCVSTRRATRDSRGPTGLDRRDRGAMVRGDASIAGPDETGSRPSRPGDERAQRPALEKRVVVG